MCLVLQQPQATSKEAQQLAELLCIFSYRFSFTITIRAGSKSSTLQAGGDWDSASLLAGQAGVVGRRGPVVAVLPAPGKGCCFCLLSEHRVHSPMSQVEKVETEVWEPFFFFFKVDRVLLFGSGWP